MKVYLDLVREIITHGEVRKDRTGFGTMSVFGRMLKFDLQLGFPATTTKRLAFGQVKRELACFLNGYDNLQEFHEMGCTIWDKNAEAAGWMNNPLRRFDGDLGRIYGVQWRGWRGRHGVAVDQLRDTVTLLRNDPWTRRAVVTAFNPAEMNEVCLPPCHTMFQFSIRNLGPEPQVGAEELDCAVTMRSVDTFLGMPFDIGSYALLIHIVAQELGIRPGSLTMWFGDTHVYLNHLEQCREMLMRTPGALPSLTMDSKATIDNFHPDMAFLEDYLPADTIKASMNP